MNFTMNGIEWTVRTVPHNSPMLMRSDGSKTVGMCDRRTKEICISDMVLGGFRRKILIHEVCHAAIFSYGIDLSIPQEEFLCDFIATYGDEIFTVVDDLFAVLRRIA